MQDFINKIFGKKESDTKSITEYVYQDSSNGFELLQDTESVSAYNNSIYVKTAMDKINTVFSSVEIELLSVKNSRNEVIKVEKHEIIDILEKPNDYQSKTEFMSQWSIFMKLSGECFIKKIKENNKLIALVIISPEKVTVKVENGFIIYEVINNGRTTKYGIDEIIHTKKPNPCNPLRGVGALSSIVSRIKAERRASDTQNNALTNGSIPSGMLKASGLDKEQTSAISSKVRNMFSGKNDGNKLMVLGLQENQTMEYTRLDFSNDAKSIIESMKFLRDDISAALGVPKSLLTSDDVNLANATTGYKQFINLTIEPMVKEFIEMLNESIIAIEYSEPIFFSSRKIDTQDRQSLVNELSIGIDKWITINEARELTGLSAIENGNELYRQNSTVKLQDVGKVSVPVLNYAIPGYAKQIVLQNENITKIILQSVDLLNIKEVKDFFIKSTHSVQDRNITKFDIVITKFFSNQEKNIINSIKNTQSNIKEIIVDNTKESKENLKAICKENYLEMVSFAGKRSLDNLKTIKTHKDSFFLTPQVISKVTKRAKFFSDISCETTQRTLLEVVTTGLDEGFGRDKIANIISETFSKIRKTRATTIAQTEGTAVSNIGLLESYNQSSAVSAKKWLTVGDHKVRESHVKNNNQIVEKNEVFSSGEHYPAEHSINCRCVIAPVVKI
jgi:HK97 family phage portal protein